MQNRKTAAAAADELEVIPVARLKSHVKNFTPSDGAYYARLHGCRSILVDGYWYDDKARPWWTGSAK